MVKMKTDSDNMLHPNHKSVTKAKNLILISVVVRNKKPIFFFKAADFALGTSSRCVVNS